MTERVTCEDCSRIYGEPGFPDLIIPNDAWRQISTHGDETGLLCPSCMLARLERAGVRCYGALVSGPVETVSPALMTVMRWAENLREQGHGWRCPSCNDFRRQELKVEGIDSEKFYSGQAVADIAKALKDYQA